jgi:hypothetical protein
MLGETYPEAFALREMLMEKLDRKEGDKIFSYILESFGDSSIDIPSIQSLNDLYNAYMNQPVMKMLPKPKTFDEAIKNYKRRHELKSPSELKNRLKRVIHRFDPSIPAHSDVYFDEESLEYIFGKLDYEDESIK